MPIIEKMDVTLDLGVLGECDCIVSYTYYAGCHGRDYLANGDPGYPSEPPEVEVLIITCSKLALDLAPLMQKEDFDSLVSRILENHEE